MNKKLPPKPPIRRTNKKKPTRLFRKIVLFFFVSFLSLAILSILWVLAYRWINPPITELMLKRSWQYHSETGNWAILRPDWADREDVPDTFYRSVLAGEDQRFDEHWGFDFEAIEAARKWNSHHRRTRGASTVTQQVAKNVFLWEDRTWLRKGLEAWFTVWIELLWSKERTLEIYANVVELGPWTFGVENAAHRSFGKNAKRLSLSESALLASALPKPSEFNARQASGFYRQRQSFILENQSQIDLPW